MDERLYSVWLASAAGMGCARKAKLLRAYGTAEAVYRAPETALAAALEIPLSHLKGLLRHDLKPAEAIIKQCEAGGITLIPFESDAYPARLKTIYDPPMLLYVRGALPPLDDRPVVAVVGTRKASSYGVWCAKTFARDLTRCGAVVVSGLALGVDVCASRGALSAGGPTLAVLGCGVDVAYPRANQDAAAAIAAHGALISEYPPGTRPERSHFPERNRILSGLSDATLVVEAPEKSGAMITACSALEQGRDVYAVPGPVTAESSRGCNRLIRAGAGIANSAFDLLEDYAARYPDTITLTPEEARSEEDLHADGENAAVPSAAPTPPPAPPTEIPVLNAQEQALLSPQQRLLLEHMTPEPLLGDDLADETGLAMPLFLSLMTVLQIQGYARDCGGGYFRALVRLS